MDFSKTGVFMKDFMTCLTHNQMLVSAWFQNLGIPLCVGKCFLQVTLLAQSGVQTFRKHLQLCVEEVWHSFVNTGLWQRTVPTLTIIV